MLSLFRNELMYLYKFEEFSKRKLKKLDRES